jgi:hypothetical protein
MSSGSRLWQCVWMCPCSTSPMRMPQILFVNVRTSVLSSDSICVCTIPSLWCTSAQTVLHACARVMAVCVDVRQVSHGTTLPPSISAIASDTHLSSADTRIPHSCVNVWKFHILVLMCMGLVSPQQVKRRKHKRVDATHARTHKVCGFTPVRRRRPEICERESVACNLSHLMSSG